MVTGIENEGWQAGLRRGGFLGKLAQRWFPGNGWDALRGKRVTTGQEAAAEIVSLSGKELQVLDISEYGTISCLEGVVWITFPRRFCDYVLKEGESLSLRGEGRLVISGGCRRCTVALAVN